MRRHGEEDEDERVTRSLAGLAVILLLVVLVLLLVRELRASGRMQDCLMTGSRHCAELDMPVAPR